MVTRRDLRAERDFYSPMTGDRSSTYGSQVRSRLEDIKNVKGTRAPAIEAAFVKLLKTEDPFTQIDEKKSYAPDEEDGLMGALEGLGDGGGSDVVERVEEFLEPIVSGGGGGNKPNVVRRNPNDRISRMSTSQLVDRDNRRYGNTVPDGSFGINSKSTDDFSKDPRYASSITTKPNGDPETAPKTEETRTYYGQGGLPLGTTTIRQGGEVKDGKYVGPQEKGPAINASGFQQKNVRGSGNPNNTGKDESARPKQTVASLPSNYKATEQKAFAAAKAYKSMTSGANVGSGAQANKGTGKDGGFGTGTYGKGRPSDSKTTNKATPSQATAVKKSTTVKKSSPTSSGISKSKSRGQGGSKTSSSKKSSGSKSGGSKSSGSKSSGSKSNSGSKKSSRGAKGSSSSSSKGGTSKGPSRRANTRRSRRRCDIRCKVDISALTNLNLIKDDLADVAYFVRELQE